MAAFCDRGGAKPVLSIDGNGSADMGGKALNMKALILFGHGARDERWAAPFHRLRDMTAAMRPDLAVELAFLEFMEPALPTLVLRLVSAGCTDVTLVPIFFGQGGHVLRDLPLMLEELRRDYSTVTFRVADAVGESEEVLKAIATYCLSKA
jgi:sirohydrochlorin cobaltochelatase